MASHALLEQLSRRAYAVILQAKLTPSERLVLMYYAAHADYRDGGGAGPSKERCAETLHLTVKTVRRACQALEAVGLLQVEAAPIGAPVIYRVNLGCIQPYGDGISACGQMPARAIEGGT